MHVLERKEDNSLANVKVANKTDLPQQCGIAFLTVLKKKNLNPLKNTLIIYQHFLNNIAIFTKSLSVLLPQGIRVCGLNWTKAEP